MKHDWVRVYSPKNPVFMCRKCGARKTFMALGRRKGKKLLFRYKFQKEYWVGRLIPRCQPGEHAAAMRDVTRKLKEVFTPEVIRQGVELALATRKNLGR